MHVLISSKIASLPPGSSPSQGRRRQWHSVERHCGRVRCSRRRLRDSESLLYSSVFWGILGLPWLWAGSQPGTGGGRMTRSWAAA
jgi:hypothetical protein